MKTRKKISHLKGRNFNGRPYPKIRRVRQEPRQKIRQLLRSFIPIDRAESKDQNGKETQT